MIRIRPFHEADESHLARLYEATVRRWAPQFYSPEQVEAWAMVPHDRDRFRNMLCDGRTFVAVNTTDQSVGFCGVESDGRVASLYVAPDSTRRGIGTALLRHVVAFASEKNLETLWAEASYLSRPLFERNGFSTTNVERIFLDNVEFERWIVRRNSGGTG
jgi:putative acetyltransferase